MNIACCIAANVINLFVTYTQIHWPNELPPSKINIYISCKLLL